MVLGVDTTSLVNIVHAQEMATTQTTSSSSAEFVNSTTSLDSTSTTVDRALSQTTTDMQSSASSELDNENKVAFVAVENEKDQPVQFIWQQQTALTLVNERISGELSTEDSSQAFMLQMIGDKTYVLKNQATGLYLSVTQSGDGITTTHDVVGEAQKWRFQFASDGTYALYSTIGGYLEINDDQVVLTNELTTNRQWTIKPIITTPVSDTQSSNETSSEMNTTTSTSEHETTTSSSSLSSTIESTETETTQEKARSLTPLVNQVTTQEISKTQMKITITNPNGGNVSGVKFPTWSNTNGQDDIKWLEGTKESNGAYSVVVNSAEYRHSGLFNTHIYGVVNGKLVGLGTSQYTLAAPASNTIVKTPISKTQMKITITNPNGGNVSGVKFPTWSNTNGQDDIKWLEGTKESNGAYSVVVNSAEYRHSGLFNTHIYGVVNGKLVGLATTIYTLTAPTKNALAVTPISKTQMRITIANPMVGTFQA
ncbi:GBS Bsp-like repeat-containing protein [Enterococcus bulliens]